MNPTRDRRAGNPTDTPAGGAATAADRERQITMFNRKAVVVLAAIGGMTVMVVSFAFNAPKRSTIAADGAATTAEQVRGAAAQRNYLASPPDTGQSAGLESTRTNTTLQTGAVLPDQEVDPFGSDAPDVTFDTGGGTYDPYVGSAYAAYTVPSSPPAPARPEQPSARELAFERAMRCGIRSCLDESLGVGANRSGSEVDYTTSPIMQEAQTLASRMVGMNESAPAAPDRHEAFLRSAGRANASPYVASQVERPISPYQIMAGTLIPATLVTAINSDLPGEVVAQVTRNVYDTQQRHLLIPAGSKVLGRVDNQVGLGQARVNISWYRLIFPNNNSLTLPGFGGVDAQGAAGIRDRVNNNYTRTYVNALLLSAITAGAQLSQPQPANVYGPASAGQVAAGALGQQMGEVSSEMIRRNMQVGPTLQVRPGFQFSIYVSQDLVLAPYDHYGTR